MEEIKSYVLRKKELIKAQVEQLGNNLKLVIVQVNDDPASNSYIKGKLRDCAEVGINAELIKLPIDTTQDELLDKIALLNNDKTVTGFIVQMPLPKGIDEELIKKNITPSKDVDGFNFSSEYTPATPKGILTYLEDQNYDFDGKNALVIGRSNIVGKPIAKLLLDKNMNVTIVHSHTNHYDLANYIAHSDLIIVAIGKPQFINKTFNYKKNCVVFDVGISRVNGKLEGDCEPGLDVEFQSPVPGGVGLLTRLSLMINLLEVYEKCNLK